MVLLCPSGDIVQWTYFRKVILWLLLLCTDVILCSLGISSPTYKSFNGLMVDAAVSKCDSVQYSITNSDPINRSCAVLIADVIV